MIRFTEIKVPTDKIFAFSDPHWGHKNISQDSVWDRASNKDNLRPWNMEKMNQYIIDEINNRVPYDGVLICGGDWSFGGDQNITKFRKQLAVDTIICATGNHDHHQAKHGWKYYGFDELSDHIVYLNIGGQKIVLSHYPLRSWHQQHRGAWNLFGHVHGNLEDDVSQKSLDIGFDTKLYGHEQYTLYSFKELRSIMEQKQFTVIDHHRPENPS